ncbi:MAG: radical SAM protein, partial [Oscillospiraceae bacterium]
MNGCKLCPRQCNTDRSRYKGFCKSGNKIKLARASLHFWEEPCISGQNGSGTVFFSGCNLKCVFCQNYMISHENFGEVITVNRLAEIFLELQAKNAHNINLVSGTHFIPQIIEALDLIKERLGIPIIWNTSGYETIESLELLKDYINIFLTDLKYKSSELSAKFSAAENYFEYASSAVKDMIS